MTKLVIWWCALALGGVAPSPRDPEPAPVITWPADAPADSPVAPRAEPEAASTSKSPPPPRPARGKRPPVRVAVGLSPEAPGSKTERALLDALESSVVASTDPPTTVRRLRVGAEPARVICRERRDDFVVSIGYVPGRKDAVLLAHDCVLDRALGVRSAAAAREPGLIAALWDEHERLVQSGARERRRFVPLGPRARGALIGVGVAVVVGVAVGLLVASALREDRVVLTVSP